MKKVIVVITVLLLLLTMPLTVFADTGDITGTKAQQETALRYFLERIDKDTYADAIIAQWSAHYNQGFQNYILSYYTRFNSSTTVLILYMATTNIQIKMGGDAANRYIMIQPITTNAYGYMQEFGNNPWSYEAMGAGTGLFEVPVTEMNTNQYISYINSTDLRHNYASNSAIKISTDDTSFPEQYLDTVFFYARLYLGKPPILIRNTIRENNITLTGVLAEVTPLLPYLIGLVIFSVGLAIGWRALRKLLHKV